MLWEYLLKLLITSIVFVFLCLVLVSIGKPEAYPEFLLLGSLLLSGINTTFIAVLEQLEITNFRNRSIFFSLLEVFVYIVLVFFFEEMISWSDYTLRDHPYLGFPFTYLFPFVLLFPYFYLNKKRTRGVQ